MPWSQQCSVRDWTMMGMPASSTARGGGDGDDGGIVAAAQLRQPSYEYVLAQELGLYSSGVHTAVEFWAPTRQQCTLKTRVYERYL